MRNLFVKPNFYDREFIYTQNHFFINYHNLNDYANLGYEHHCVKHAKNNEAQPHHYTTIHMNCESMSDINKAYEGEI